MTFERRILLIVAALLILAAAAPVAAVGWGLRDAALARTRGEVEHAAVRLARSAHLVRSVPAEVEAALTDQILAQAALAAQYAASAEAAKLPVKAVADRLKAVTDSTALKDIQVTDSRGKVVLGSAPNFDFTFTADGKGAAFLGLLSRTPAQVTLPAAKRDDGRLLKSVGVAGADKPRIVQVTAEVGRMTDIARRLGTLDGAAAEALAGGAAAAWVLGGDGTVLGRAGSAEAQLSPGELDAAKGARRPVVVRAAGTVSAVAPLDGGGAAVVRMAVPGLPPALWGGLAAGGAALVLGVLAVRAALRRQAAALATLTAAATAMENGRFNPFTLDPLRERPDEVGRLARAFRAMAGAIDAREQGLEAELQLRAAKLEEAAETAKAPPAVSEP